VYVAELRYPGNWICVRDPDPRIPPTQEELDAIDLTTAIKGLEQPLAEAALALNLFEGALLNSDVSKEEFLSQPRELTQKHERWRQGILPLAYRLAAPFLFAKSFINALWRIESLLSGIRNMPGSSDEVRSALNEFRQKVPSLQEVRDAVAHYDERAQRKARRAPLEPKSGGIPGVSAPDGTVLALENLHDNAFGTTDADGEYRMIQISEATVEFARQAVQRAIDSFEWSGFPNDVP